jgi:hypothetical protein
MEGFIVNVNTHFQEEIFRETCFQEEMKNENATNTHYKIF